MGLNIYKSKLKKKNKGRNMRQEGVEKVWEDLKGDRYGKDTSYARIKLSKNNFKKNVLLLRKFITRETSNNLMMFLKALCSVSGWKQK